MVWKDKNTLKENNFSWEWQKITILWGWIEKYDRDNNIFSFCFNLILVCIKKGFCSKMFTVFMFFLGETNVFILYVALYKNIYPVKSWYRA
jgi:hypothetical protein